MESFRKEAEDINENQMKILEWKNRITNIKVLQVGSKPEWKGQSNNNKLVNWKLEQKK